MKIIKKLFSGYETKAELRNEIDRLTAAENMYLSALEIHKHGEYAAERFAVVVQVDVYRDRADEVAKMQAERKLFDAIKPNIKFSVGDYGGGERRVYAELNLAVKKWLH